MGIIDLMTENSVALQRDIIKTWEGGGAHSINMDCLFVIVEFSAYSRKNG